MLSVFSPLQKTPIVNVAKNRYLCSRCSTIHDALAVYFGCIVKDIVEEISAALNERQKKVVRATDEMITDINAATRRIKQAEEQLFRFDGIKTFVFWFGQIVNIVTIGLLIWWMFLR